MAAYYNEIDAYAAQWLRNLIAAGQIAPGDVDERDIRDVRPSDLASYRQCHFFAGVGVWSLALRNAGWPDDLEVWTGSCPCQPFSAAGAGAGFADERHLWPHFHHLIRHRRPAAIFGEQVASKNVDPWIDLVQDDLEAVGYAVGAVPFPAAGVGAPHIRDRTYWVAYADNPVGWTDAAGRHQRFGHDAGWPQSPSDVEGRGAVHELADTGGSGVRRGCEHRDDAGSAGGISEEVRQQRVWPDDGADGAVGGLDHHHQGSQGHAGHGGDRGGWAGPLGSTPASSVSCGLADDTISGRREERPDSRRLVVGDRAQGLTAGFGASSGDNRPGPTNGMWGIADWLLCRDGKWRPVEPGTFPLAHGATSRVGRLRAYGNAIVEAQAREFIIAAREAILDHQWAREAWMDDPQQVANAARRYIPGSAEAAAWQGWGTALKPAWEPMVLARKPLIGTVAENVLRLGVGALNIDGCRIHADDAQGGAYKVKRLAPGAQVNATGEWKQDAVYEGELKPGRWPANLMHDGSDEVVELFPREAGAAAPVHKRNSDKTRNTYGSFKGDIDEEGSTFRGDSGSAARFFYCAKASKADRGEGNNHPTVKPHDLMRYLCRLITPPGGLILDPFAGSGSTGKAAVAEGFDFIGCELSEDYAAIARRRIAQALAA